MRTTDMRLIIAVASAVLIGGVSHAAECAVYGETTFHTDITADGPKIVAFTPCLRAAAAPETAEANAPPATDQRAAPVVDASGAIYTLAECTRDRCFRYRGEGRNGGPYGTPYYVTEDYESLEQCSAYVNSIHMPKNGGVYLACMKINR
jgi:hypothetical protein